jgi:bacterioferritin (cytochrome b1)
VPEQEEKLDEQQAISKLNTALRLQNRSVIEYTLVAAGLTGFEYQGLADRLIGYAREEIDDARRLAEKIVSFEGEPTTVVAKPRWSASPGEAFGFLIEDETETIEALQASIEPTGREGRSEALEHRLEHMIMRKQEQVDFLDRARRGA